MAKRKGNYSKTGIPKRHKGMSNKKAGGAVSARQKRLLNLLEQSIELKNMDSTAHLSTILDANTVTAPLTGWYNQAGTGSGSGPLVIPRGDGSAERDGSKIFLKSLQLRGTFTLLENTTTGTSDLGQPVMVRLLVVRAKNRYQIAPDVSEFIDQTASSASGNTLEKFNCFYRRDRGRNFDVLLDKFYNIRRDVALVTSTVGQCITGESFKQFNEYIPINKEVIWEDSNSSGAQEDIQEGAIYVFAFQRVTTDIIPDNFCDISLTSRVKWMD